MQKRSAARWLVTAYVMFMAVWLCLRLIFFDQLWPLALLNTIAQYLFVPLPILLLVTLWQRDWISLLKLGIPLVMFAVLFGALFLPSYFKPAVSEGKLITVMSFV